MCLAIAKHSRNNKKTGVFRLQETHPLGMFLHMPVNAGMAIHVIFHEDHTFSIQSKELTAISPTLSNSVVSTSLFSPSCTFFQQKSSAGMKVHY